MWCENIEAARTALPTELGWFTSLTDVHLRTATEVKSGVFLAEGEVVIRRAHAAGYRLLAVMAEPRWIAPLADLLTDEVSVITDSPAAMTEITGYHVHRGALAAYQRRPSDSAELILATATRTLFIEGMVNHTNVGSIFRSAAAMRMDAVLLDRQCADPLYRRAIRTSMGTVFQLPWGRTELSHLREVADLTMVALTPSVDARDIREVEWESISRLTLMVGTEGQGLSKAAMDAADFAVTIPMAGGVDSLNAAAATAVACHEIMRGRDG